MSCRMSQNRRAYFKWLFYVIGTIRLWCRTKTESSRKQAILGSSSITTDGIDTISVLRLQGRRSLYWQSDWTKILKERKGATELKGEVKWNRVGTRRGWRSRMVVRGQGTAQALLAWSSQ